MPESKETALKKITLLIYFLAQINDTKIKDFLYLWIK